MFSSLFGIRLPGTARSEVASPERLDIYEAESEERSAAMPRMQAFR
jgi:hypothetical protein